VAHKNKGDIKARYLYRRYLKFLTPKEIKDGYALSQTEINGAVAEVNKKVMELIIKKNLQFIMPYNIGKISILMMKFKPVKKLVTGVLNRPIDWKETNLLWKERPELRGKKFIYHMNTHTGGYIGMFKWIKRTGYMKNALTYKFEAVKDAKRNVAKGLKDPFSKVDYYELKTREC
jgi:hypothetical protein